MTTQICIADTHKDVCIRLRIRRVFITHQNAFMTIATYCLLEEVSVKQWIPCRSILMTRHSAYKGKLTFVFMLESSEEAFPMT